MGQENMLSGLNANMFPARFSSVFKQMQKDINIGSNMDIWKLSVSEVVQFSYQRSFCDVHYFSVTRKRSNHEVYHLIPDDNKKTYLLQIRYLLHMFVLKNIIAILNIRNKYIHHYLSSKSVIRLVAKEYHTYYNKLYL